MPDDRLPAAVRPIAEELIKTPGLAGLLLVGSGARGALDKNSDWDFVAVIEDGAAWPRPFRDGGRETFPAADGRQVEVMFSSVGRLRERMAEQVKLGIIAVAEFLAEGQLIFCSGPGAKELQEEAASLCKSAPDPIAEHDLQWRCYEIWNQVKDLEDRLDDVTSAYYLAFLPFWNAVVLFFRLSRQWLPRPKMVFPSVAELDKDLYRLCQTFATARSTRGRLRILLGMMKHLSARFDLRFDAYYTSPAVEHQG